MLHVNSIDLHYGAAQALRNVSLSAEPGKVTCVLGRNGVGKTSLLDALAGQHPVSNGTITFDGADITWLRPSERARRGIAYVPQGREIFPLLTVRENLETGYARLPADKRKISEELFELFPVLKSMLARRGGDLSGGQQQQLAIARALASSPKLLLLDEPTEGVQPSIVDEILEQLLGINARFGVTMILVEQNVDFASAFAQRAYTMLKGQITEELRPEALYDPRVIADYLGV